jgi:hypothetical protein
MKKLIGVGMVLSLLFAVAPAMASEDTTSFLALNDVTVPAMSDVQLAAVEGQDWKDSGKHDWGRKGDHKKPPKHDGKGKDPCKCFGYGGYTGVTQVNTATVVGIAVGSYPVVSQSLNQTNAAAITR